MTVFFIKFVLNFLRAAHMVLCFAFVAEPVLVTQQCLLLLRSAKSWFYPTPQRLEGWEGTQDSRAWLTKGISHPIPSHGVLRHESSEQEEEGMFRVKVFVFLSSH